MPRINVNLNDVADGFELYPDDKYVVQITDKSKLVAESDAKPYIMWVATIVEGDFTDKTIVWRTYLNPEALWNVKNLVQTIGVEWTDEGFELEDCFDQELVLDVGTREYDGKDYNQVNGYAAVK